MAKKMNAGFGLVQAVLLLAVGGSIIGIVTQRSANLAKSARKIQSKTDLMTMRNNLFQNVICPETFKASLGFGPQGDPCPTGQYINIRSKTGILVNIDGSTQIGEWSLMAYCSLSGLDIRAVSLLPAFRGELEDKKWVGKSAPTNLDHYRLDEFSRDSSSREYSWAHPVSQISKPDSTGLCAHWFSGPPPPPCSGYAGNANVNSETQACRPAPNCAPPRNLVFDRSLNRYVCRREVNDNIMTAIRTRTASEFSVFDAQLRTRLDRDIIHSVNDVNAYIDRFPNMGDAQEVFGYTYGECANLGRMKCPPGYAMWGYEAYMPMGGHRCRLRCIKVQP